MNSLHLWVLFLSLVLIGIFISLHFGLIHEEIVVHTKESEPDVPKNATAAAPATTEALSRAEYDLKVALELLRKAMALLTDLRSQAAPTTFQAVPVFMPLLDVLFIQRTDAGLG